MQFTNVLATGETISSINGVTSEKVGGYTSDLGIASTGVSSDSKSVTMYISSGTLGSTYRVEILIATNASQILEGDGILFITDT